MKKIKLLAAVTLCSGASVFMISCGGNTTETTPDETSIESEQMYERGGEPLQSTGDPADTTMTSDTTTTVQ